ncbi:hypothetical protein UA08_07041 [Talaromyces atroroseus]|uniref:Ferrochelatase n=1 Tax=Talaromyces atroroseus TaxID=1441469 RepID=A0A225AVC4_TALAT|nr:hypothetical protein UA08_07041 [Talaromyces atroroseus]OKL57427.1 hypothetical protein UA08_07041 [Talaromyces atroroseus]
MGGPSKTADVEDFLSRLFADGDLIPLGPLQKYIGPLLARRRTPKIQKQYSDIGGGSPIRQWSEHQCEEMCKILDEISPETAPHKPYVAFRYAAPLTEEMYSRLLDDGFGRGNGGRAVAFTQYPQYSCSTTGSSLNELWKWRNRLEGPRSGEDPAGAIQWSVIDRWPTHSGLVEAFAKNIEDQLATYPEDKRSSVLLLFSAHSLPMSVVNRGDPYTAEVAMTVHAVMQRLGFSNPYRLCWQSQVGPSAWQGAQTSHTVENYVKKGFTDMILVPIAFTSDHIETLYELDIEVIGEAGQSGIKRAESLNGSPTFIRALADIARTHLQSGEPCSRQMTLRCQACTSERCLEQKKFFAGDAMKSLTHFADGAVSMSGIGGDETLTVDAEQDAQVLRARVSPQHPILNDVDDQLVPELAPLLGPESVDREDDFIDRINKPWLGCPEFDAKPPWRRPSVWWIIPPTVLFTLAFGGIAVPKVNLALAVVCRDYFADQKAKDPAFTYAPVIFGDDNDQCRIPAVQSIASRTLLYVNLISGFLSALVSPRLGELSDRHGRMPLLAICIFGTLLSEFFTTFLAAYPDSASVNWFFVAAFIDGLCGSFTLGLSLVHSYAADCTSPERRNVVFGLIHATLFSGIALGPFLFGLIAKYSGGLVAVFLAVLALHGVYFLMLVLFIPESLSKDRQAVAKTKHIAKQKRSNSTSRQNIWRELHPANIFKPLVILFPKPNNSGLSSPEQRSLFRKLRKNLLLIAAIDTLMFGVAMGTLQIIILYAEYIFGWGNYESSVFLSVANCGRVFTLLVVLPAITRLFRGPQQRTQPNSGSDWLDILCIRLAILFDLLGYIGYSLSGSGGVFILSAVVASFGGMGSPTLQSSLTKHVPPSQTGRLLGATGLLHALARVVSPVIFNLIYSATVGKFPQAVFVCLASGFALAGILSWFISPKGCYI